MTNHSDESSVEGQLLVLPPVFLPPAWESKEDDDRERRRQLEEDGHHEGKSVFDADANEQNVGPIDSEFKKFGLNHLQQGLDNNASWGSLGETAGAIATAGELSGRSDHAVTIASEVMSKFLEFELTLSNAELNRAKSNFTKNFSGGGIDPLILDLDGDGVDIVTIEQSMVAFDWDGDGFYERSAWVGADDAFLVIDLGLDGVIDQAAELTFAESGATGLTDLDRLRGYDTNNDGILNASDASFADFRVWRDLNQNGVSDAGELVSLSAAGVGSLNLAGTPVAPTDEERIYWFDTDQDGFIDQAEIHVDQTSAPPGSIVGQITDGGVVFHSSEVATVSGTIQAYTTVLGVNTDEFTLDLSGSDLQVVYSDGRNAAYKLAIDDEGQVIDISGTKHVGAFGRDGNDTLIADRGASAQLFGGTGDDELVGGAGSDLLVGGGGSDLLNAGAGDDVLFVDNDDLMAGVSAGDGRDVLFADDAAGINLELAAVDAEAAYGTAANDRLSAVGVAQNTDLYGQAGDRRQ